MDFAFSAPLRPPAEFAPLAESRRLVRQLSATRLFAKYERSYSAASGLPLSIRPLESFQMPARSNKRENPFCALIAGARKGCVACLQAQSELERGAADATRTVRCHANLYDSMVPIRIGKKVIGYLQTGQVALAPTDNGAFDRVHSELILREIDVDAQAAKSAYQQSRRMTKDEYHGFLKMLEIFADSLAAAANALSLKNRRSKESGPVARAVAYLEARYQQKITLGAIAKVSGASERHFCKVFKEETGLTFVGYLNRLRIEKAKQQLRETNNQISEIAFHVGFDSIAQFNRTFKRYAGDSPRAYRTSATA